VEKVCLFEVLWLGVKMRGTLLEKSVPVKGTVGLRGTVGRIIARWPSLIRMAYRKIARCPSQIRMVGRIIAECPH
jgi:hypothetical protein